MHTCTHTHNVAAFLACWTALAPCTQLHTPKHTHLHAHTQTNTHTQRCSFFGLMDSPGSLYVGVPSMAAIMSHELKGPPENPITVHSSECRHAKLCLRSCWKFVELLCFRSSWKFAGLPENPSTWVHSCKCRQCTAASEEQTEGGLRSCWKLVGCLRTHPHECFPVSASKRKLSLRSCRKFVGLPENPSTTHSSMHKVRAEGGMVQFCIWSSVELARTV